MWDPVERQEAESCGIPVEQMIILKSCHSDATSGHFGLTETWRRVAERFYWKGMVADTFYFYDTLMTLLKFSEKKLVEQIYGL